MAELIEMHSINGNTEHVNSNSINNTIEITKNGRKRYLILLFLIFVLILSLATFAVIWYHFHPKNSNVSRIDLRQGSNELSKYLLEKKHIICINPIFL